MTKKDKISQFNFKSTLHELKKGRLVLKNEVKTFQKI